MTKMGLYLRDYEPGGFGKVTKSCITPHFTFLGFIIVLYLRDYELEGDAKRHQMLHNPPYRGLGVVFGASKVVCTFEIMN